MTREASSCRSYIAGIVGPDADQAVQFFGSAGDPVDCRMQRLDRDVSPVRRCDDTIQIRQLVIAREMRKGEAS